MLNIKVLGTGCAKCNKLYAEVEAVIAESGVAAELHKVEDIDTIMSYRVAMTPALVIDEVVVSAGRMPRRAQLTTWLTDAAAKGD